jgi:hypothetical protein
VAVATIARSRNDRACRVRECLPTVAEATFGRKSSRGVFGRRRALALQPAEVGEALSGKLVGGRIRQPLPTCPRVDKAVM